MLIAMHTQHISGDKYGDKHGSELLVNPSSVQIIHAIFTRQSFNSIISGAWGSSMVNNVVFNDSSALSRIEIAANSGTRSLPCEMKRVTDQRMPSASFSNRRSRYRRPVYGQQEAAGCGGTNAA